MYCGNRRKYEYPVYTWGVSSCSQILSPKGFGRCEFSCSELTDTLALTDWCEVVGWLALSWSAGGFSSCLRYHSTNEQLMLVPSGVRLILGVCICGYDQELIRSSDGHG